MLFHPVTLRTGAEIVLHIGFVDTVEGPKLAAPVIGLSSIEPVSSTEEIGVLEHATRIRIRTVLGRRSEVVHIVDYLVARCSAVATKLITDAVLVDTAPDTAFEYFPSRTKAVAANTDSGVILAGISVYYEIGASLRTIGSPGFITILWSPSLEDYFLIVEVFQIVDSRVTRIASKALGCGILVLLVVDVFHQIGTGLGTIGDTQLCTILTVDIVALEKHFTTYAHVRIMKIGVFLSGVVDLNFVGQSLSSCLGAIGDPHPILCTIVGVVFGTLVVDSSEDCLSFVDLHEALGIAITYGIEILHHESAGLGTIRNP